MISKNLTGEGTASDPDMILFVELLFFAYRDFIARADRKLATSAMGRAHHRVLHFVGRYPGLAIQDLLEILTITKQSLARVLGQLVKGGYIELRISDEDKRKRQLYLSPQGEAFLADLMTLQSQQMEAALSGLPPQGQQAVRKFLTALIESDRRHKVKALIKLPID